MPICNHDFTEVNAQHAQTEPGMAYFAGTGPAGKKCGDCRFWGYRDTKTVARRVGCERYYQLTNRHGPGISAALLACKYFEQRPPVKVKAPEVKSLRSIPDHARGEY